MGGLPLTYAVPTLPVLKLTEVLDPADLIPGTLPDPHISELQAAVDAVREAAEGDSNDTEIQALQEALDLALQRWPEITRPE